MRADTAALQEIATDTAALTENDGLRSLPLGSLKNELHHQLGGQVRRAAWTLPGVDISVGLLVIGFKHHLHGNLLIFCSWRRGNARLVPRRG
ncbi:MAG: hypothetical protein ACTS5I_08650, partial [Rhodanobacter sp.]